MCTSRLAGTAIDVEVSMAVGPPLAQDTSSGVQNVHEVSVRVVQVAGAVGAHVKQDRWVETWKENKER